MHKQIQGCLLLHDRLRYAIDTCNSVPSQTVTKEAEVIIILIIRKLHSLRLTHCIQCRETQSIGGRCLPGEPLRLTVGPYVGRPCRRVNACGQGTCLGSPHPNKQINLEETQ